MFCEDLLLQSPMLWLDMRIWESGFVVQSPVSNSCLCFENTDNLEWHERKIRGHETPKVKVLQS